MVTDCCQEAPATSGPLRQVGVWLSVPQAMCTRMIDAMIKGGGVTAENEPC